MSKQQLKKLLAERRKIEAKIKKLQPKKIIKKKKIVKKKTKKVLKKLKPTKKYLKYGLRRLKRDQYVIFRDMKNKIIKTPDKHTNKKMIIEVRDKKTKELKGYVNYRDKEKNIIPRKMKSSQRKYLKLKTVERIKVRKLSETQFKINSAKSVIAQIQTVAENQINLIHEQIQEQGYSLFRLRAEFPREGFEKFSKEMSLPSGFNKYQIGYVLMQSILEIMDATKYRISPKHLSRHKEKRHIRTLICDLQVLEPI